MQTGTAESYREMVEAQGDEQIDRWAADLFIDFADGNRPSVTSPGGPYNDSWYSQTVENTIDGRADTKWCIDTPPAREMLTRDKKNLEVAWYVGWKIKDVDRFLKSVRTVPDASARLEDMAASILAAELGGRDLADLVQVGDDSLPTVGVTYFAGTFGHRYQHDVHKAYGSAH